MKLIIFVLILITIADGQFLSGLLSALSRGPSAFETAGSGRSSGVARPISLSNSDSPKARGKGSTIGNLQVYSSDNVASDIYTNGGSVSANSISIDGEEIPFNQLNSVNIGKNTRVLGKLNITLKNNKADVGSVPIHFYRIPNFNSYPQNNAYTNRRPGYFPGNQQIRDPFSQFPAYAGRGGQIYTIPFPSLWG